MPSYNIWLFVIPFFFGIWMAVARETRVAIMFYVLQTICVALLYLRFAWFSSDAMAWMSFAGICGIRIIFIPLLLKRFLKRDLLSARETEYLITPPYAVLIYLLLGIISLRLVPMFSAGENGLYFGLSLAVVLVGIAATAICHHAPKQIMSLLGADNGVDLAAVLSLQRISAIADYIVFIDVAIAVLCLSTIVLRLRRHGHQHTHNLHDLRG